MPERRPASTYSFITAASFSLWWRSGRAGGGAAPGSSWMACSTPRFRGTPGFGSPNTLLRNSASSALTRGCSLPSGGCSASALLPPASPAGRMSTAYSCSICPRRMSLHTRFCAMALSCSGATSAARLPSSLQRASGRMQRCLPAPSTRSWMLRSRKPTNTWCCSSHPMPRMSSYGASGVTMNVDVKRTCGVSPLPRQVRAASEYVSATSPAACTSLPSASVMRRDDGRSCAPQRATNAGSTKPMPDAPLSIIGCTGMSTPPVPCTLPCTLSSADGSVRAPCNNKGASSLPAAVIGGPLPRSCCGRLQPHDAPVRPPPFE